MYQRVLRPFFHPRRWKMGGFFVTRAEKVEDGGLRSSEEEVLPPLPSFVRSSTYFSRPKIVDGGVLRSSAPKIEDGR